MGVLSQIAMSPGPTLVPCLPLFAPSLPPPTGVFVGHSQGYCVKTSSLRTGVIIYQGEGSPEI